MLKIYLQKKEHIKRGSHNVQLERTGYSALPSPPRLMRHAVAAWPT